MTVPAAYSHECPRCGDIVGAGDPVVPSSLGWIHARCAPGGDD